MPNYFISLNNSGILEISNNIEIPGGTITSSSDTINFDNENLITTGNITTTNGNIITTNGNITTNNISCQNITTNKITANSKDFTFPNLAGTLVTIDNPQEFSSLLTFNSGIQIGADSTPQYIQFSTNDNYIKLQPQSNNNKIRTITLPAKTGTIALANDDIVTNQLTVNGYIGIGTGTSSPERVLHIKGGSTDDDTRIRIESTSDINPALEFKSSSGNITDLKLGDNDTLHLSGNLTCSKDLTVNGITTFNSNITVTGTSTFNSNITVNGTSTFNNNLTVNGNIKATDDLTLTKAIATTGQDCGTLLFQATHGSSIANQAKIYAKDVNGWGTELKFATKPPGGPNGDEFLPIDRMTINNNGNVGIGTTTPTGKLHVDGNIKGTGTLNIDGTSTFNDIKIGVDCNIELQSNYSQLIFKGTDVPGVRTNAELEVISNNDNPSNTHADWIIQKYGIWPHLYIGVKTTGSATFGNTGIFISEYRPHGIHHCIQNLSGNKQTIFSSRFKKDIGPECYVEGRLIIMKGNANNEAGSKYSDDGYVGIGTTNPSEKLDVNGNIKVNGTSTFEDKIQVRNACIGNMGHGDNYAGFAYKNQDTPSNYALLQESDGTTFINCANGKRINFRSQNSDRMIIQSDGNVGIGTFYINYIVSSPERALHIKGDTENSTRLRIESASNDNPYIEFKSKSGNVTQLYKQGNNDTLCLTGNIEVQKDTDAISYIGRSAIGYVGHSDYAGFAHLDCKTNNKYAIEQHYGGTTNINCASGTAINFRSGNGDKMIIKSDGNVGIGTTDPTVRLEISGRTGDYYRQNGSYVKYGFEWNPLYRAAVAAVHRVALKINDGNIFMAGGPRTLYISSDSRIKTNIVDVPDNLALEQLRNIPCRYYEYIDKFSESSDKTIGFIAQEVKKILPMAVSQIKQIIPNVYKIINSTWTSSNNTFTMTSSDLENINGIKYRFYVSNETDGSDEEKIEIIGNSDNTFTFDTQYNNVFCYGSEVDDFNILDKNKLFTLNFSATQEIDKIQQTHITKIERLEEENIELKSQIDILKTELSQIKNILLSNNIT